MDYTITTYIIYVIFGLLPSLAWLFYYLRKDLHPEPKRMIVKIFLWGAVVTLPVFFIQIGLNKLLELANFGLLAKNIIYWFLIIALSEEFFKYLIIKFKVLNSPDLDEPLDIMLYMVVAALGFAAVENILVLFSESSFFMRIIVFRFLGAVLLHTLSSGTLGYFLALSFFESKKRLKLLVLGFGLAVILHGFFNYSIMKINDAIVSGEGNLVLFWFRILVIFLIGLAVLIFLGFRKLKKIKSVCEIKIK